MYQRSSKPLKSNSFFLFGARGTGKTSLLKSLFTANKTFWINLLEEDTYRHYLLNPEHLEQINLRDFDWVVIDEIQRVPALLNHVHKLIESDYKTKYALTGSSARKLKRAGANLLAGRAFENHLHPLTVFELKTDFHLLDILNWGSLPKIFSLEQVEEKKDFLRTYVNTYIRNEIKEEQIIRKLEPFLKFLSVAAQMNGKILNFSKMGRDCGVDSKAIERYFEILFDTLLGFYLEPFHESVRKRQVQKSKFYFFDLGVKRALERTLNIPIEEQGYSFGDAFEHLFVIECFRLNDYYKKDYTFSYLRTKDDLEVDLIVDRPGQKRIFIEIKSTATLDSSELSRYQQLVKTLKNSEFWFVTREKHERNLKPFRILPWKAALEELYLR